MDSDVKEQKKLHISIQKFYFLEYFYILLKSVDKFSSYQQLLESFKKLKQEYLLGESKYKKLSSIGETPNQVQINRYNYTFGQVFFECLNYGLVAIVDDERLVLTEQGKLILNVHKRKGQLAFNLELFKIMEDWQTPFKSLINFCYKSNLEKNGLLIFPVCSPLKLGMKKTDLKTTKDIYNYTDKLIERLEENVKEYLNIDVELSKYNEKLIKNLRKGQLIERSLNKKFDPKKYYIILKRVRDFWINVFLREIYNWNLPSQLFDILIYRGKQFGAIHATEFFPDFDGRVVYPTSIIHREKLTRDFQQVYKYKNGEKFYIHNPDWKNTDNQEEFVKNLTTSYFALRKKNKSYFVNLLDIKEMVCYAMKIPEFIFDDFLKETYKLNLRGRLKNLRISLESDKLPSETNAMYLKRMPVTIDGKLKNIIAIDYNKKTHG